MFTPWNEVCAVRFRKWGKFSFPSEKGPFQGYQAIPLGPAPWNLHPARNVETNGHIEVEYFNLLTPDVTIPLGPALCNACPVEFRSADPLRGIPQGVPISLGSAPWNEILPNKYLSPGIPVVQLWQNPSNLSCAIPLGSCQLNIAFTFELCLPREIHASESEAYFIGELLRSAPCALLSTSLNDTCC